MSVPQIVAALTCSTRSRGSALGSGCFCEGQLVRSLESRHPQRHLEANISYLRRCNDPTGLASLLMGISEMLLCLLSRTLRCPH